jgi:hypothetical protein
VQYDTSTKKWSIDYDTSINYDEGDVWNTATQKWETYWNDEATDDVILTELKEKLNITKEA